MNKRNFLKPDGRRLILYSRRPIPENIKATNPAHNPIVGSPHLRWHPLRGEWVAFASHRQNRTFLPPKEYSPLAVTRNPELPTEMPAGDYDVAVFENLFPSLSETAREAPELPVPTRPGLGVCEVVVFTQNPDTSLGALSPEEIELILKVWADRTKELGDRPQIDYVLPFENRGVEVGVTLHHPHGQIYSYPFLPPVPAQMQAREKEYFEKHNRVLLQDLIRDEEKDGRRLVCGERTAIAWVPVCARYPFETWIAPKRPAAWLSELSDNELKDLARTLKITLMKFDRLWNRPFPYLMVLYQAPTDGLSHPESHLHFEIYPPYRTRDKLKFLAGTEIGAGLFINDTWPEEKAAELRAVEVAIP
jgi:UDPglucose--hexose-1-phosphate uridylyltransferase